MGNPSFLGEVDVISEDVNYYKEPEKNQKISIQDENVYGRCLYLLDELQITLPRWLAVKIPYYDELLSSRSRWSILVTENYAKGKSYGKGSTEELKEVLDAFLHEKMESFEERQKFVNFLGSLANGLFDTNIEVKPEDLKGGKLEKFDSGFSPVDKVLGGFYQGVFTFAGLPGSGKSSILINLAYEFAKKYPVWYFQTEVPSDLIQPRIAQLGSDKWTDGSMIHIGNYNSTTILEKVLKNPCKDRIIIYDSPEIVISSDLLKYWETTMQELVQIKLLSKCVLVTSQIKQDKEWNELAIYSLAGSAHKGRYSDSIVYLNNFAGNLMIKSAKNRFGTLGNSVAKYNYDTMKLEETFVTSLFD